MRAKSLHTMLWSALLMMVCIAIMLVFIGENLAQELLLVGLGMAVVLVSLVLLLRRGSMRTAGLLAIGAAWTIFTFDLAYFAGIRGTGVVGQILAVMMAGIVLGWRAGVLLAVLGVGADYFILVAEQSGALQPTGLLGLGYTRWLVQGFYILLAAVFVAIGDRNTRSAFQHARQSAQRYQALFEQTNDAVFILGLDYSILAANHQAAAMIGYSLEELVGMPLERCLHADELPDVQKRKVSLLAGTRQPMYERVFQCKDGSTVPTEVNIALVYHANGKPLHIQSIVRDIAERKRHEQHLKHLALHDPLTSLPNRTLFDNRLQHAVIRAARTHHWMAILFFDLDNFKRVNDLYGHEMGDRVLQIIGRRLQSCIRKVDTVARLGGDEFTILLEDLSNPGDAGIVAQNILDRMAEPIYIQDVLVTLSGSIGIRLFNAQTVTPATLMRNADSAMYRAKERGKNNYQYYGEGHTFVDMLTAA